MSYFPQKEVVSPLSTLSSIPIFFLQANQKVKGDFDMATCNKVLKFRLWSLPLILLWLSKVSAQAPVSAQTSEPGKNPGGDALGCDLRLAESSIPNAGLGVYAVRDFKLGEAIVSFSKDL
jgi:hypothetical protein